MGANLFDIISENCGKISFVIFILIILASPNLFNRFHSYNDQDWYDDLNK